MPAKLKQSEVNEIQRLKNRGITVSVIAELVWRSRDSVLRYTCSACYYNGEKHIYKCRNK